MLKKISVILTIFILYYASNSLAYNMLNPSNPTSPMNPMNQVNNYLLLSEILDDESDEILNYKNTLIEADKGLIIFVNDKEICLFRNKRIGQYKYTFESRYQGRPEKLKNGLLKYYAKQHKEFIDEGGEKQSFYRSLVEWIKTSFFRNSIDRVFIVYDPALDKIISSSEKLYFRR